MAFNREQFELYFGAMQNDCPILMLQEICLQEKGSIISGPFGSNISSKFFVEEGIPVIRGNNLSLDMDKFIDDGFVYVTQEKADSLNTYAKIDDLIFTAAGTIGQVAIITDECKYDRYIISNKQLRATVDKAIVNPLYAYYWFANPKMSKYINLLNTGSTIPLINLGILRKLPIPVPTMEIQNKIVSILGCIDEKIELNNKLNANLYDTIAAMYKHDYIDEISKQPDWKEVTLDDITSKFATGLNPRKNFVLGHGNNYYVTIKNMNNNRIYLDSKCDMVDDESLAKINKRSDLQVGDLLFSGIGTIGRVHLIDKPANNWNISESVFTMRPTPNVSSEFMYLLLLSYDMQDYAVSLASGSVQKGIRMADLKRYKLMLPSLEDMERLTSAWKPIIAQIKKNEEESDKLALLRDTLLPKLMNGEINVSELEI